MENNNMNTSKLMLTYALQLSKLVHNIYDSGKDTESENWYHGHFISGVNPYYSQTKNSLIVEGYYGIPVSKIHTPLGYWSISGSGSGRFKITDQLIREKVGLKLICPGYQTYMGFYGPYWLVTSINGQEIPHDDIKLLPPIEDAHDYDKSEVTRNKVDKYLEVLSKFYKDRKDYVSYEDANTIFDQYLNEWLHSGLIGDTKGYTGKLMKLSEDSCEYMQLFEEFLNHIESGSRWYVTFGHHARKLFKLIYHSKLNSNE